ncbi:hypothetical protein V6N11_066208 [Hibiscus sabdariffa]|uniref:Secreted protein n=1 Tax=Hibiscus sabdariffa TaxID=183260 RepID=A0ABR2A5E8_9ROSI
MHHDFLAFDSRNSLISILLFSLVDACGRSGGLSIRWKPYCTVSLRSYSRGHIDELIEEDSDGKGGDVQVSMEHQRNKIELHRGI